MHVLLIVPFLVAFSIGAICEEVGWCTYLIDPMQKRWGALRASIFLGVFWGTWHAYPWFQGHNTVLWVVSQWVGSIALRVIIVWLYNNSGKNIVIPVVFHGMVNASEFLFPNFGSHYNPTVTGAIFVVVAIVIVLVWGPRNLSRRVVMAH